MSPIVPIRRPQMTRKEVLAAVKAAHPGLVLPGFFVVGIRGYYKKTFGHPDKNDRRFYDDAIFLVSDLKFESFNANCDPAAYQPGIANLKAGVWPAYRFDKHKGQYMALCQRAGKVTVIRDDKGEDTGMFGINIHRGGNSTTSSLGCQTIPPGQWDDFINIAQTMSRNLYGAGYTTKTVTYILLEN